jgi:hypothetical protein
VKARRGVTGIRTRRRERTLKTFYTDHCVLPLPDGQCFPMEKSALLRERVALSPRALSTRLLVDRGVHQDNAILADDPSIFASSIHGAKTFRFPKSEATSTSTSPTAPETKRISRPAARSCERARPRPPRARDLPRADPDADDRFGRLALSRNGLRQRDRLVLETLRHSGIPTAVTMAGGYARRIEDTVDIHFATVATAATFGR